MKKNKKKLLILGGSRYILPVIDIAHKLGIYVITCDYLPDNIAHKYSDEYVNISIIDKDKVFNKAKELNINGIMSFACDPGVETASYVAEKLGLPNSGPYESVKILQNKGLFRKFLTENGFNVPVAKSYHNIDDAIKDTNIFNWPVIVKPTDSAGSKGVRKVLKKEDLKDSIENALNYSHSNEFIIEDFLEKDGNSSDCDSFSINGKLVYVSFSSQKFDKNAINPYVPSAYSWPSSISDKDQKELSKEIQRLLKLLNMKTSLYNIETRKCTNGKTYIMECSPRGGGNRLSEMMKYVDGVDLITSAVNAAVGNPVNEIKPNRSKYYWCEIILHSPKNGVFDRIEISDEIKDNIIEKDIWVQKGDIIKEFTGANETIGTMVMKFNDKALFDQVLNDIDNYIKTIVE